MARWKLLFDAIRAGAAIFVNCRFLKIPGISYDGGYAPHVIVPVEAARAYSRRVAARRGGSP